MKLVITSGYFNPFHFGHLSCLLQARKLGDRLLVIVNTDAQVFMKGSRVFMNQSDRMAIVGALKPVNDVFLSIDQDGSVCRSIEALRNAHPHDEIIFAKGGDRFASNVPEVTVCERLGIRIVDGLGAKIRASSEVRAAIGEDKDIVLGEAT